MNGCISDPTVGPLNREKPVSDVSEILVVFVEHTECRQLRWLKRGFRHCFVALRSGSRWIICDSLKNHIECSLVDLPSNFDLPGFYLQRGHKVVIGHSPQQRETGSILPEPLTCVTVTKRIIGLRSFWTLTPWQLFRRLTSMGDRWRLVESGRFAPRNRKTSR